MKPNSWFFGKLTQLFKPLKIYRLHQTQSSIYNFKQSHSRNTYHKIDQWIKLLSSLILLAILEKMTNHIVFDLMVLKKLRAVRTNVVGSYMFCVIASINIVP